MQTAPQGCLGRLHGKVARYRASTTKTNVQWAWDGSVGLDRGDENSQKRLRVANILSIVLVSLHREPEQSFEEHVATRYRLYSGLFLGLPYSLLQRVGRLLPVFTEHCRKGLQQKESPSAIMERFFAENPSLTDVSQNDAIFLFLQLIERQVVLFDALEDASFSQTHDLDAPGSVSHIVEEIFRDDRRVDVARLLDQTATRIVLTAHPTQFYPDTVQGIIHDLRSALSRNAPADVEKLLLQLGKTRFSNHERPTPVDEARSVLRSLEDVFYPVLATIAARMLVVAHGHARLPEHLPKRPNIQIGFWPGGDRDGNPFVTAEVTFEVARLLKERVLERHHATAVAVARRLTFEGVYGKIQAIVARLRSTWFHAADVGRVAADGDGAAGAAPYATAKELQSELLQLRHLIVRDHQSLFLDELDDLIVKVHLFGFHFASLDLRQSSDVFFASLREIVETTRDSNSLSSSDRLALTKADSAQQVPFDLLERLLGQAEPLPAEAIARLSPLAKDTLEVLRLVPSIQESNGELGLHRLIISHTRGPEDPLVVLVLARMAGLAPSAGRLDIVPLFESIDDLERAETIVGRLLQSPIYREVLDAREQRQVVMMGFSDGTKDGGYLTANWSIRRAKRRLTKLGRSQGVRMIFFDGRGGPPARGGGNTHRFYRSRDAHIEQLETQLTIQGQTISSNFGSPEMAHYHVEQLFTANIENLLSPTQEEDPAPELVPLVDELSTLSFDAYRELRDNPALITFLAESSPLPLFDHLTNASRPVSRRASQTLDLESLRAIPLVATWSVLKIQISGFYGFGSALEQVIDSGREEELQRLYRNSRFFRALVDNTAMSAIKSRFDITAHLERDERFRTLWRQVRDEAVRVERCILRITRQPWLLANDPLVRASIHYREEIILPLLVIVHDAFARYNADLREGRANSERAAQARRMALKGIAAVINATRNAA
jgi:phosphoenolpyruvate carboxylase